MTVVWGREMKYKAKEYVPLWELQDEQKVGEFYEVSIGLFEVAV
ncbi:hypothetical protein ABE142_01855 [Paenibacillus alvei]|nr:hypothetical protein [Paenibacillus alvei]